jgi:hypothetical protein
MYKSRGLPNCIFTLLLLAVERRQKNARKPPLKKVDFNDPNCAMYSIDTTIRGPNRCTGVSPN